MDGPILQLVLGEYSWRSYRDVGDEANDLGSGLLSLGHRPRETLVIFCDTCAEWMITALACFQHGFIGTGRYRASFSMRGVFFSVYGVCDVGG